MFEITSGDLTTEVWGRSNAVEKAKEISSKRRGPVRVTRNDRNVEMLFSRGSLTKYHFNTRSRRRR